jgi:hypothetical protein
MDPTRDYPYLSKWPARLGPAPTRDHLIQAYALLLHVRPRARPSRSRRALAVAAYLSGHYWHPDDLGVAIDAAMGTPDGAANDPRNVIIESDEGLESCGLVTLNRQRDGRREKWSCKLTAEGESVVVAYCALKGVENPLATTRDLQSRPGGTDATDVISADGPTRGPPPSTWTATVSRNADAAATTYAFRFGKRDIWKIGHAQDLSARLDEVNKHVPDEVLGERWSIAWRQPWRTQTEAYEMEQRLLSLLTARG